jgi:hypothetical protein
MWWYEKQADANALQKTEEVRLMAEDGGWKRGVGILHFVGRVGWIWRQAEWYNYGDYDGGDSKRETYPLAFRQTPAVFLTLTPTLAITCNASVSLEGTAKSDSSGHLSCPENIHSSYYKIIVIHIFLSYK